jgi:PAS domain S-box-containing protein
MSTYTEEGKLLQILMDSGKCSSEAEEARHILDSLIHQFGGKSGAMVKKGETGDRIFLALPDSGIGVLQEEIVHARIRENFNSLKNDLLQFPEDQHTGYLFRMEEWGFLYLVREAPFREDFLKNLASGITHLGILLHKMDLEEQSKNILRQMENLTLVASKTSDIIIAANPRGEITYVNNAFEQISGYKAEEVMGRKPGSFLQGPDTSNETRQKINEALKNKRPVQAEILNYSKDGKRYWQYLTINPVLQENGEFLGYVSVNKDITERKELESRIRRKENIVKAISRSTDILLTNPEVVEAISQGLSLIGEAAEVDRTYLFQNSFNENNELVTSQRFEWNSGVAEPQIDNPELQGMPIAAFEDFLNDLYNKREFKAHIKDLKTGSGLKEVLEAQHIISILLIPVFVKDLFWGFVGYDECKFERTWDEDELSMLKSFSNSVSSAIERDEAIREMNNMVLFPQENPNPLFRVNLRGELVLRNKAAEKIDYFIYENTKYAFADFAKKVSEEVNEACPEIHYEVNNKNEIYQLTVLLSRNKIHINCYASNVTDLKNIQNELQRLSLVARINRRGVLFTDSTGKINYANEAFLKNTGYTQAEVMGMSPIDLCQGPLSGEASIDALIKAYQNSQSIDLEIIMYRKDLSWFWANIKSQPLERDKQGDIEFFSIIEDITDKKQAEEILRDSENRLSTLIMNLKEAILLEDQNRRIVLTNENFCKTFHIPVAPELLTGADCSTSAEDSKHLFKNPDLFVERITQILKEKKMVLSEELEMVNGQYLERDYIPITIDNIYRGHLWKYHDITERKNYEKTLELQEEKYRNIIANMNMGLFEVGENRLIQHVNQQMAEMSGYSIEEILGKDPVVLFIDEESRDVVKEKKLFCTSGTTDYSQVKVLTKNGECKWWLISGAPNYNDEGVCIGSVNLCFDNTEQKRLEEELKLAMGKAEESSRAKEAFLANMSHEIRTPLNAITGMISEISRESFSPKVNNYINHLKTASQHLLSLVNDILDISKIEARQLHLELRPFSVREVIREAIAIESPIARERMLDLHNEISDTVSEVYIGDPIRIRQILINMLSNAVKFTEKGKISVTCEAIHIKESKHKVIFTITDTGIGMDEAFLKKIFGKFMQEDASIVRKYGGTGLGLTITNELVQLMEGHIKVDSVKGSGTTIKIMLTLETGKPEDLNKSEAADSFQKLKNTRILLVEDNDLNRLVVNTTLSHYDVIIYEAVNGKEAVKMLGEKKVDIILMDLQMPVMDGMEATRIIRNEMKITLPIIALTANAFQSQIDQCMAAGMNDYITKPFEKETLLAAILRNLGVNTDLKAPEINKSTEMINPKLYSLDQLLNLSRGNMEFIRKMITLFSEDIPKSLDQIHRAIEGNDLDTVKSVAHRIKASIGMMQIAEAYDGIRKIENLALEGAGRAELIELFEITRSQLLAAIEQMLKDPAMENKD